MTPGGNQTLRAGVIKWGSHLALPISEELAAETGLADDSEIDIRVVDGQIIISPIEMGDTSGGYTLETLLDQITDEMLHPEINTGDPAGNEVW